MHKMKCGMLKQICRVACRECGIMRKNKMYMFCIVVFPVLVTFFFTSLMSDGQPTDMPVGVVDLDNTPTTRALIRKLDAFQATKVVGHYSNVADARRAIQRNKIYAFLYIPNGTTDELLSMRQPKISFYYSTASYTAGALLFRDLKTIATLGSASVGASVLSAKGLSEKQVMSFLQPVVVDLHTLNNPMVNYSVYLNTMLIPGCLMLFIFLITAYSLGTELKFNSAREWISASGDNIFVALVGKMLPQTLMFLVIMYAYMFYVFGVLNFPHPGGTGYILMLGLLAVLSSQGFGIFVFGIVPSLRMSMSICCLWAVLSYSLSGTAFPLSAMDSELKAIALLFPLRHYYMIYQLNIFNGYPIDFSWPYVMVLVFFAALPIFVSSRIKKNVLTYKYLP
ncbi:putative uncharacterized protein [Prevotella sp. CAG:1058]|nr:putative uncharacterized protein [Prevotella sp. CAG:1058]